MVRWALAGLDLEIAEARQRLDALQAQAAALRGNRLRPSTVPDAGAGRAVKRRRKMSPATRRRLSELMKQRWAARKAGEKKR